MVELPDELFEGGMGLALKEALAFAVALERGNDRWDEVRRQRKEFGFGPAANGKSWGDMGSARGTAAIRFAALATQADEGSAQDG